MNAQVETTDVLVIGGGPAGSTTSTLVSKADNEVILLEKAHFPRYRVGESLLPATVHGICEHLGVKEKVLDAGFPVKRGGTYHWGEGSEPFSIYFADNPFFADTDFATALQVERAAFDDILLKNADQKGVDVRCGAEVKELEKRGDGHRVEWVDDDGKRHELDAQFVVDASGYQSSFYDRVGERIFSDYFQNIALFGYFDGGDRLPEPDTGNMLSVSFDQGWVWYLPLRDGMTSVGAVFDKRLADELQNHEDRRETLQHFIQKTPEVAELLGDAPPVEEGPYSKFRMRKDYSYCNTSFWDNGLLLVGDSACFIDPVFATGVHFATYGGLLAARSLNSILQKDLDPGECFREFEHRYKEEFSAFYDFLLSFYNMEASSADSYFWKAKQVLDSDEPEREAFVRLIGGGGTTLEDFARTRSGFGEVLKVAHSSDADSQREQLDHISRTVENADELIEQVMESRQKRGAYRRDAFQGVDDANLDVIPPAEIGFEHGYTVSRDGLYWEQR